MSPCTHRLIWHARAQEPDKCMRLRGSSGTDERQHYVDDGLQHKYEGLHRAALELSKDLTTMAGYIGASFALIVTVWKLQRLVRKQACGRLQLHLVAGPVSL